MKGSGIKLVLDVSGFKHALSKDGTFEIYYLEDCFNYIHKRMAEDILLLIGFMNYIDDICCNGERCYWLYKGVYVRGATYEIFKFNMIKRLKEDYMSYWGLMAVVEKIESLGYIVSITGTYCMIIDKGSFVIESCKSDCKIVSVYGCCVSFVKWYNENNGIDKGK